MAPPQVFVIDVDNGDKVFYPGSIVSGRVNLQTSDQKKLRGIYLTLVGRAYVLWTETRTSGSGDDQTTETEIYQDEEPYFNFKVNLWGGDGGEHFLQPGNYQFPFSFKLPEVPLPTSHEGGTGHVRYWLEARMDRPWKFDHVTKRAFTILERVDLNLGREDLAVPRRGENQKTLGCLCCKTGPLTLTASTDRGGYCPGENILVTAHVGNDTNKEMRRLKATLYRHVVYYAEGSFSPMNYVVSQMQTNDPIPARGNFDWNQQPLPIPPSPPSSQTCRIIHTDYTLDIEVVVPTFSINLHLNIPIVIGTEPLRSVYANSTLPTIGWGQAEAVNIADNQYTMGHTQFAPLFPMVQLLAAGQAPPPQYPGNPPTQPSGPYPMAQPPTHPVVPPAQPRSGPTEGRRDRFATKTEPLIDREEIDYIRYT